MTTISLISEDSSDSTVMCFWCRRCHSQEIRALWRAGEGFIDLEKVACTMHAHLLDDAEALEIENWKPQRTSNLMQSIIFVVNCVAFVFFLAIIVYAFMPPIV